MRSKLNWIYNLEGGNPLVWRSMKTTCYKGSLTLLSEVSMGKMIYGKGVEIQPPPERYSHSLAVNHETFVYLMTLVIK